MLLPPSSIICRSVASSTAIQYPWPTDRRAVLFVCVEESVQLASTSPGGHQTKSNDVPLVVHIRTGVPASGSRLSVSVTFFVPVQSRRVLCIFAE